MRKNKKPFSTKEYFSKSTKKIKFDSDWESIISVIKNEKRYINNLIYNIEDTLEEENLFGSGLVSSIEISLGNDHSQEEPDSECLAAIQYIKVDFLKFLEHYKIVRKLNIENKEGWGKEGEGPFFNISANFIVDIPNLFRKRALEVAKIYSYRTKEKSDKKDKITLDSESLNWRNEKIILLRNRYMIMEQFYNNAEIHKGDKIQQKGKPIDLKSFVEDHSYDTYDAVKDALKKIRSQLKKFPASIVNRGKHRYLMIIRYP